MSKSTKKEPVNRVGWRVNEWLGAVPISRAQTYEYIGTGYIPSVKIGGARVITESPSAFIERHREPAAA